MRENMAMSTGFSIPLYENGKSVWRQGVDAGGEVDVAAIEIERGALPTPTHLSGLHPANLPGGFDQVEIGVLAADFGFPLGFHDTLHHMPVARQGVVASSFGLRFQGQGYFLTDARTHRGASGAPVVARVPARKRGRAICPGRCSASIRRGSTSAATSSRTKRSASIAPGTPIFCSRSPSELRRGLGERLEGQQDRAAPRREGARRDEDVELAPRRRKARIRPR